MGNKNSRLGEEGASGGTSSPGSSNNADQGSVTPSTGQYPGRARRGGGGGGGSRARPQAQAQAQPHSTSGSAASPPPTMGVEASMRVASGAVDWAQVHTLHDMWTTTALHTSPCSGPNAAVATLGAWSSGDGDLVEQEGAAPRGGGLAGLVQGTHATVNVVDVTCDGKGGVWCAIDQGRSVIQLDANSSPIPLSGPWSVAAVCNMSAGDAHWVAVLRNGGLAVMGSHDEGQCGLGKAAPRNIRDASEVALPHGQAAAYVACGGKHTLVVTQAGTVYACGANDTHQLGCGNADTKPRHLFVQVHEMFGLPVSTVAAGANHSVALTRCGNVFVWGSNAVGQLGRGQGVTTQATPAWLEPLIGKAVTHVAAGANRTYAVGGPGAARATHLWAMGQVEARGSWTCIVTGTQDGGGGDGEADAVVLWEPTPVHAVSTLLAGAGPGARMESIVCGEQHTLVHASGPAPTAGGADAAASRRDVLIGWGANESGQLSPSGPPVIACPQVLTEPLGAVVTQDADVRLGLVSCGPSHTWLLFHEVVPNATWHGRPQHAALVSISGAFGAFMLSPAILARHTAVVAQWVHHSFAHAAILNSSFLFEDHARRYVPPGMASPLDMADVRGFYIKVLGSYKAYPMVKDALLGGICEAIDRIYSVSLALSPESLRVFQILMECPLLLKEKPSQLLPYLDELLHVLLSMPTPLRDTLLTFISQYEAAYFSMPLSIFQAMLTYLVSSNMSGRPVSTCCAFLSHLNAINSRRHLVPYTRFYNAAVNQRVPLDQEYWRWRQRQFSFCQYPFLLDANSKSRILQVDASISMKEVMQSAIVSSILQGANARPHLGILVRRQYIVQDALHKIAQLISSGNSLELKKPLKIKFHGEEGIDAGGVKKEFFQLITAELFDPKYGMFKVTPESESYWFNPFATESASEFGLVGTVLGLAIYNGVILDCHLPMIAYKKLCGLEPTFADLQDSHPRLASNLTSLLEYDGDEPMEEVFYTYFSVDYNYFGAVKTFELIPGGRDIPVSVENRQQYVELMVKHVLEDGIRDQFTAFAEGFKAVSGPVLTVFRAEELELLICGNKELKMAELKPVAKYKGGYSAGTPVIKWFWEIVLEEYDEAMQRKVLKFATASDRVPIAGMASLEFVLQFKGNDIRNLPTASTCFNTLLIPQYKSKKMLRRKLTLALEEASGFGLK